MESASATKRDAAGTAGLTTLSPLMESSALMGWAGGGLHSRPLPTDALTVGRRRLLLAHLGFGASALDVSLLSATT